MPIDPSIPLQVNQGSPMQSMGQTLQPMVSLAQLANIRQQNQMMQAETLNLQQQASQGAQLQSERQAYSAALQDPNSSFYNADGTVDPNKFQVWATHNIPLSQNLYGQELLAHTDAINKYKTTVANMSQGDHQIVNAAISSFVRPDGSVTSTPQQMGAQLDALTPQLTGYGTSFVNQAKQAIANTASNPQALGQVLTQLARTTTPATTQQDQRRASTALINNGAATVPVSNTGDYGVQPGTPTGGGIANQVGPEGRQTVTGNPLTGGMSVVNRDANGNITGVTNPPTQGVYVPQPGDVQALPELQAERDSARTQYTAAGTQHENNRIVLSNIDNVGATGVSGPAWRNIASVFGLNPGDAKDSATAYDMVGKGLERSALQAAQSMGPQTNAGLDAQIKANGSLGYTPQAIKEITKLNDALVTGTQSYQPGLERAIAANPSAGVFAKRQFDQAWGANFDPTIFRYYNAIKNGDAAEQQAIVKQLGGLNSKGYNAMMQKAKNLQQLSNTGSLQ
ncbi:hypothetical protein AB1286_29880 [Trinickia sp. NRRL B-1857]|uniref:hypothetical protein n=1 Tax=Trinickia sp. NRRL B-1857 TaxID=3162879 RepID=UPI003D2A20C6